jgi:RHS repeat-associated protein
LQSYRKPKPLVANQGESIYGLRCYDNLDRLLSLKNGATNIQSFTYDATGNRLNKTLGTTVTTNTIAPTSHRLTQDGATARTYDANGNTATIGVKGYVYDDRNRLRDYKNGGTTVTRTYRYNGKGERVSKVVSATSTSNRYFFYDEAGHLLGEYLANGTRVQEYVWLDDQLIAVLSDHDASTYQFVETDHLGTPRAVIHPVENNIVWRWNLTNTAFGEHIATNNPDADAVTYTFNLRYPGQMYDSESGLHYNYFRDYEPGTGRYVQSDPIGLAGGVSSYGYVGSSPLIFLDPKGLARQVNPWGLLCQLVVDILDHSRQKRQDAFEEYVRYRIQAENNICMPWIIECKYSSSPSCVPDRAKECKKRMDGLLDELYGCYKEEMNLDKPWWESGLGETCGFQRYKKPKGP